MAPRIIFRTLRVFNFVIPPPPPTSLKHIGLSLARHCIWGFRQSLGALAKSFSYYHKFNLKIGISMIISMEIDMHIVSFIIFNKISIDQLKFISIYTECLWIPQRYQAGKSLFFNLKSIKQTNWPLICYTASHCLFVKFKVNLHWMFYRKVQ